MKCPPCEWEDLWAMGLPLDSGVYSDGVAIRVEPQPPRLVGQLLRELAARPAPEGDRLAYLRHVRDLLMGLTDWTQTDDAPLTESQQAAWATYRQALRDLPGVYSGAGPIPWPTAP
jgi:hypothetical protein